MHPIKTTFFLCLFFFIFSSLHAQMITGVWKGRINKEDVEVKIVQEGDKLTGSSYYFGNKGKFRRYSIKGYFDENTNEVRWWDDQLLENSGSSEDKDHLLFVADFNCPGGGEMSLEGRSSPADQPDKIRGSVELTKTEDTRFPDEWDFVIENYTLGANQPWIIDSIETIAKTGKKEKPAPAEEEAILPGPKRGMVMIPSGPAVPETSFTPPKTIEEKFIERKKIFTQEIPVRGDSIELRFYDNAEIDGDSISLFLNGKMIFTHIKLGSNSHVLRLAVADLENDNELIMVAENLGSIPPNTAYMLAIVEGERFESYLSSTEEVSAMIRLRKPPAAEK